MDIIIVLVFVCLMCISISVGVFFATSSLSRSIWKRSSDTQAVGGNGGSPSSLVCKENTFVTEFNGSAASYIDRISIKCSDGTILGPAGGSVGPFSVQSVDGFDKLVVRTGALVDSIQFFNNNKELAKVGGNGGGGPTDLACNGGRIMGVNTRSDSNINNIQVVCATQQPQ